jgi:hypoxanthine phosphoribosyltransferase
VKSLTSTDTPMKVLITTEQIQARVVELSRQISRDYAGRPITLLGVLNGSLMFLADLVRKLDLRSRIGFIQASSYRGATTTPRDLEVNAGLVPDIRGKHVLLLDDILDSGQTLVRLVDHMRGLEPASLKIAVMLRKSGRQQVPCEPDYCGFEIPDVFVVGYGMDYDDEYRQLPYVAELDGEV